MSLTVVKRPLTYILDTVENPITITGATDLVVNFTSHGLSSGDYVYLKTTISIYNGQWYVQGIDANSFNIREYQQTTNVQWVADATGVCLKGLAAAAFEPVHSPLVYKIQSNIWPVNGADTARSVSSFSNYNGYTALNLSGDIKATGTASALEQVIIDGTTSLDGVYKILNWFSDSSIVIDMAYSASNSFAGGTVQYYYFNYHARIKVFAGILSGNYAAYRPVEQVAEIRCVPDSTGLIIVNVSEFVKKKIAILTNNPLLVSLPNNIDAYCGYYISVAESYDDSDGYTVSEYVSSYTADTELYAVNSRMPFKTRQAISSYQFAIPSGVVGQDRFLTLFSSPTLFPGYYFDLSFFVLSTSAYVLRREVYVDDVLKEVFDTSFNGTGTGVYRMAIAQSGWSEDRIDVTLYREGVAVSETLTIDVATTCASQNFYITWLNYLGGYDYWNFTARKTSFISNLESKTQETNTFPDWPNSEGEFATTKRQQTVRRSRNALRIESQNLTQTQVDAIKWLFSSPLVQIVDSVYDRRTIIVDAQSVQVYKDQQDLFTIGFNASYTDELPSQSL